MQTPALHCTNALCVRTCAHFAYFKVAKHCNLATSIPNNKTHNTYITITRHHNTPHTHTKPVRTYCQSGARMEPHTHGHLQQNVRARVYYRPLRKLCKFCGAVSACMLLHAFLCTRMIKYRYGYASTCTHTSSSSCHLQLKPV